MKSAVINFKTEAALKKKAQKKAQELGMSLSDVLNTYLRKFLKAKDVAIVDDDEVLIPTPYLEKMLKESKEDIKKGYVSPSFDNAEDSIAWLNDPNARYVNGKRVSDSD